MADIVDFKFVSDQVQECLNELFNEAYDKTQHFIDAVCEVSMYLIGSSTMYDYVLERYSNVTKEMLNRMIISNFLEITYYRRKIAIPLDAGRLGIINELENLPSLKDDSLSDLVCFDAKQFFTMLNDVLLYFWHLSPIYSYNVVQSMMEDGFDKKLHDIYPLSASEHMLTLEDSYTRKEFLLYTFYEVLINATEKIEFSNGEFPVPDAGYTQRLANILKKYNGHYSKLPNIHKEIFEAFTSKIGINNESVDDKMLLVEIVISTIRAKQNLRFPLDSSEKRLIDSFGNIEKTSEAISMFYDNNGQAIISILLNNWNCFDNEELLKELPELRGSARKPF